MISVCVVPVLTHLKAINGKIAHTARLRKKTMASTIDQKGNSCFKRCEVEVARKAVEAEEWIFNGFSLLHRVVAQYLSDCKDLEDWHTIGLEVLWHN